MLRHLERYRSGYNGTVLKTVVRQRTVGSNPTLSAKGSVARQSLIKKNTLRRRNQLEKYSSWWRGAPAKGVGRVTGAGVRVSPSPPRKKTPSGVFFQWSRFCKLTKKWRRFADEEIEWENESEQRLRFIRCEAPSSSGRSPTSLTSAARVFIDFCNKLWYDAFESRWTYA